MNYPADWPGDKVTLRGSAERAREIANAATKEFVEMGWLGPLLSEHALMRTVEKHVAAALAAQSLSQLARPRAALAAIANMRVDATTDHAQLSALCMSVARAALRDTQEEE